MKLIQGNLDDLKSQTSYDIKFEYDSVMTVGQDLSEKKYLENLRIRWEEKERGKGMAFVKMWYDDRQRLYEPAFIHGFEKASPVRLNDKNAKYILVMRTNHTEGGWDFGLEGSPAIIGGELLIIESADHNKVKAIINFYDARGTNKNGGDFEMTARIKSAYANAGRWLGIFLLRKSK